MTNNVENVLRDIKSTDDPIIDAKMLFDKLGKETPAHIVQAALEKLGWHEQVSMEAVRKVLPLVNPNDSLNSEETDPERDALLEARERDTLEQAAKKLVDIEPMPPLPEVVDALVAQGFEYNAAAQATAEAMVRKTFPTATIIPLGASPAEGVPMRESPTLSADTPDLASALEALGGLGASRVLGPMINLMDEGFKAHLAEDLGERAEKLKQLKRERDDALDGVPPPNGMRTYRRVVDGKLIEETRAVEYGEWPQVPVVASAVCDCDGCLKQSTLMPEAFKPSINVAVTFLGDGEHNICLGAPDKMYINGDEVDEIEDTFRYEHLAQESHACALDGVDARHGKLEPGPHLKAVRAESEARAKRVEAALKRAALKEMSR